MAKNEIKVLGTATGLAMPSKEERASKRGNKAKYDLSGLAVGTCLEIAGTSAKNLSGTLKANNAKEWPVLDTKGNPKTEPVKDAAGAVVGTKPVTAKRVFFATDVNPPAANGATVRIWREA